MPKTTKTVLVRHESRRQAPTQPAATAAHQSSNTRRCLGRTRQRAREERSTPLTSSPIALRTTTAPRLVPRQQAGKAIAHPAQTAGFTPAKQRMGGFAVLLADVLGVPVFPTPAEGTVSRADPAKPALYRSLPKQALNRKRRRRIVQEVPFEMALEPEGLTAADIPVRHAVRHAGLNHRTWAVRVADPDRLDKCRGPQPKRPQAAQVSASLGRRAQRGHHQKESRRS